MSWSVMAIGRPAAVAASVAKTTAAIKCVEPEETIKNAIAGAIATALGAFPPTYAVRVEASGSQSTPDHTKPAEISNSLSVKIEPIWGFVE